MSHTPLLVPRQELKSPPQKKVISGWQMEQLILEDSEDADAT